MRRNPKISGTTHNVFGIQTGVAIGFFVRDKSKQGECRVHYSSRDDSERATETLTYLRRAILEDIDFDRIAPDESGEWLNRSAQRFRFRQLMSLINRRVKSAGDGGGQGTAFRMFANAAKSNRDDWVYDFSVNTLRDKALFFADSYNEALDKGDTTYNPVIKWSRDLRNEFQRGRRITYSEAHRIQSLFRPFVVKHHFADFTMNDVLTRNHYEIFGPDLKQLNKVINVCVNGKDSYVLASDRLVDYHFTGDTQCLPLYCYTEEGERVTNITEWGMKQINEHYRRELGAEFEGMFTEGIGSGDIFAYTYAVLHDPVYRRDYVVDLLREFPRLPLYRDFNAWARMGQELLDLHIGFESADPYPLQRTDRSEDSARTILRADKERGAIVLDDKTTLTGVPPDAWRYQLGNRSALEWCWTSTRKRSPGIQRLPRGSTPTALRTTRKG